MIPIVSSPDGERLSFFDGGFRRNGPMSLAQAGTSAPPMREAVPLAVEKSGHRVLRPVLRFLPMDWISAVVVRLSAYRVPAEDRDCFLATFMGENGALASDPLAQLRHLVGLRALFGEPVELDEQADDE
ncbi:hypothetical protein V5P93_000910 [Actinokineospora auranticolor]|uniref:Uncharacterized protein n=1 Tax=Actinokineospora auranticolor TaxID=155976 RepID=A0A2S6GYB0_9PSEU|nr:hypothetical protein [Actinokineospora auranticolor]PPK70213.1 hypothetical protein CLV40_102124 [Actinokineospora auranticolor]